MKTYSRYDVATGLFTGHYYSCNLAKEEDALAYAQGNAGDGFAMLEGQHDHTCKCVDLVTLKVQEYTPPQPDSDHDWDAASKRWMLKPDVVARNQRVATARATVERLQAQSVTLVRQVTLGHPDALAKLKQLDADVAAAQAIVDGTA